MEPLRRLTQEAHSERHWMVRAMLKKKHSLRWNMQLVTQAPVLACNSPKKELVIQWGASSLELCAAPLQEAQALAIASRALTDRETRYATIDKEMPAVSFALEKLNSISFSLAAVVRTDHKPLEAITKKPLDRAPRRLQGSCSEVWPMIEKYSMSLVIHNTWQTWWADHTCLPRVKTSTVSLKPWM